MSEKKCVAELVAAGTWSKLGRTEQARRCAEEIGEDILAPLVRGYPVVPPDWPLDDRQRKNFRDVAAWLVASGGDSVAVQDGDLVCAFLLHRDNNGRTPPEIFFHSVFNRPRILRTQAPPTPEPPYEGEVLDFFYRAVGWRPSF